MEFQQIKTGNGNITLITEETIQSISCVKVTDDSKINNFIYEKHKELLRIAKNKNKSWEVAMFINLLNTEECYVVKGTKGGVNMRDDIRVISLLRNSKPRTIAVLHNHPKNGFFSGRDIASFSDYNSIYFMTAVCNDGTIYMMRKEANFNPFLIKDFYNTGVAISKQMANEEIENKIKRLGLNKNK